MHTHRYSAVPAVVLARRRRHLAAPAGVRARRLLDGPPFRGTPSPLARGPLSGLSSRFPSSKGAPSGRSARPPPPSSTSRSALPLPPNSNSRNARPPPPCRTSRSARPLLPNFFSYLICFLAPKTDFRAPKADLLKERRRKLIWLLTLIIIIVISVAKTSRFARSTFKPK